MAEKLLDTHLDLVPAVSPSEVTEILVLVDQLGLAPRAEVLDVILGRALRFAKSLKLRVSGLTFRVKGLGCRDKG